MMLKRILLISVLLLSAGLAGWLRAHYDDTAGNVQAIERAVTIPMPRIAPHGQVWLLAENRT
jgi:hypothetical protein